MKTSFKRKRIVTVLLSAMVMTCNALSFQSPISTAAAEQAALAEDAVPFDRVDGLAEGSYSPDKVIVLLKRAYNKKYNRFLKKIFSNPMFKSYEVLLDPETANPDTARLFVAAQLNSTGTKAIQQALDYLQSFDEIYYAGPDQYINGQIQWAVNDPATTIPGISNWNGATNLNSKAAFDLIHLYDAWDITHGSPTFVLANWETLNYNHKDLAGQMWNNPDTNLSEHHGYNYFQQDGKDLVSVFEKDNDHGTFTAGVMCAAGNNEEGSAGIAYGSKIMATMGSGGQDISSAAGAIKAFNFMNRYSAQVVNFSWAHSSHEEPVLEAIKSYKGLVFGAAGNSNINIDKAPVYPASYCLETNNVIAVASVDNYDNNVWNYGPNTVQIAAPEKVVGTGVFKNGNKYESNYGMSSGTSIATPVVAGVAALIWSANPTLNAQQVKNALLSNADYVSKLDGDNGNGVKKVQNGRRVNAYNAVKAVSVDAGNYFFRSKGNGRYLDLKTSTNTLITHDFNAGTNQKFSFSQGKLKSIYNNKYIAKTDGKSKPVFSSVNTDTISTDIAIAKNISGEGYRIIKSVRVPSKDTNGWREDIKLYALTVKETSSASSEVIWKEYNSSLDSQIWYIEDANPVPLKSGVYAIRNHLGKMMLDINMSNGNLRTYNTNSRNSQKWQLISAGNGQYYLKTKSIEYPGYLMNSASTPAIRPDTKIKVALYRNIDDKTGKPDGTYRIHYCGTCWCLRVKNNSPASCTPVIFDSYYKNASNNTEGFRWDFAPIG